MQSDPKSYPGANLDITKITKSQITKTTLILSRHIEGEHCSEIDTKTSKHR